MLGLYLAFSLCKRIMEESTILFSRVLKEDINSFTQWQLTVSEFRGEQYLNLREYFLSFEGTWEPTKKGVTVQLELSFTSKLLKALEDLLKEAENTADD